MLNIFQLRLKNGKLFSRIPPVLHFNMTTTPMLTKINI